MMTLIPKLKSWTLLSLWLAAGSTTIVQAKLADRSRLVKHLQNTGKITGYHDNGHPIEGQSYRSARSIPIDPQERLRKEEKGSRNGSPLKARTPPAPWQKMAQTAMMTTPREQEEDEDGTNTAVARELSSQLSGCCYNYKSYSAASLCALYGNDCESGETPSHDSGDEDCTQQGLSFIGISFSVNTASGNPYSYQLCDQFPMENIIDRDYEYVMSMDEDGWLVGGGYKTFDYSGKMPYVQSLTIYIYLHTKVIAVP